jgi:hypothetical protein
MMLGEEEKTNKMLHSLFTMDTTLYIGKYCIKVKCMHYCKMCRIKVVHLNDICIVHCVTCACMCLEKTFEFALIFGQID